MTETPDQLPDNIGVRLVPKLAAGNEVALAQEFQALGEHKNLDADGFFQFSGLAPGSYMVIASAGESVRAVSQPFEAWEGEETRLQEPLVLREPLTLEISIDPPVDVQGAPWEVVVSRATDDTGRFDRPPVFLGETREGRVSLPGQFPGTFSFWIGDGKGAIFFTEPGWEVQSDIDASRLVKMEVHRVSGTVLLDDEPLDATVWFGGRYGNLRIPLQSHGDAGYVGLIPVREVWVVEIETDDLGARLERVVRLAEDDDEHVVDFELPNTEIFGRVESADGTPVARAAVIVNDQGAGASTKSDEAGEFTLRGFQAGEVRLHAMVPAQQVRVSEVITLPVVEDAPLGPVVLTLVENREFQGIVLHRGRPVAGALVEARPFPLGVRATARTGADGRFVLHLRQDASGAEVVVSPSMGALTVADVRLVDGVEMTIEVAPVAGAVTLRVAPEAISGAQLEFFQNGRRLSMGTLLNWLTGRGRSRDLLDWNGGDLELPDLAPGDYRACLGVRFDRAATPRCDAGTLAPGGTLTLDLRPPS